MDLIGNRSARKGETRCVVPMVALSPGVGYVRAPPSIHDKKEGIVSLPREKLLRGGREKDPTFILDE